jgi:type I restriction enzyme R subunit
MKELLLGILKAYNEAGSSELAQGKLEGYLRARYGGVSDPGQRLGGIASVNSVFINIQFDRYRMRPKKLIGRVSR